jgi:hypothetical protein
MKGLAGDRIGNGCSEPALGVGSDGSGSNGPALAKNVENGRVGNDGGGGRANACA